MNIEALLKSPLVEFLALYTAAIGAVIGFLTVLSVLLTYAL